MPIIVPEAATGSEVDSYNDLIATVEAVLGRSLARSALTMLTSDINKRLRVREMLADVEQESAALPVDFLEAEIVKVGGVIYPPAAVRGDHVCTYAVKNGAMVFNPASTTPDLFMRYYQKLEVVSDAAPENAVLTKYPEIYIWGALAFHARLVRDESGVAAWEPAYLGAIAEATKSDVASRMDNAPTRVVGRAVA